MKSSTRTVISSIEGVFFSFLAIAGCGDDLATSEAGSASEATSASASASESASTVVSGVSESDATGPSGSESASESGSTGSTSTSTSSASASSSTGSSTTMGASATDSASESGSSTTSDSDSDSDSSTTGPQCVPQTCGDPGWSYIWIANSGENTVSKIDTRDVIEVGRYRTRPDGSGNPSRTSVSIDGRAVAIANRLGGLTKIYSRLEDCVDLNNNGMIDTSTGKDDVLPFAEDECIAWHNPFSDYTVQRPVAWTSGPRQ